MQEEGLMTFSDTEEYQALLEHCKTIRDELGSKTRFLIALSYFKVGAYVNVAIQEGRILKKYGNSVMTKLSYDVHIGLKDLHYSCRMADKHYNDEKDFTDWWDKQTNPSWTWIKTNILQDPLRDMQDTYSLEAHAEEVMRSVEKMAEKMEELNVLLDNPQISEGVKEQIYGVYQQAKGIIGESIVAAAENSNVDIVRDPAYLGYIRTLECCVCGQTPTEAHHVETGGIGLKCSDFATIPLCGKHHREIQANKHIGNPEYKGFDIWRECATALIQYIIGGKN